MVITFAVFSVSALLLCIASFVAVAAVFFLFYLSLVDEIKMINKNYY